MKILMVTGIFPPDGGGPAIYTQTLADNFSRKGHYVRVITYGESRVAWYKIISVGRKLPWFFRHAFFGLYTFFNASWADVVYAQDPMNPSIVSWISARVWRKKFVVRIAGDVAWEQGRLRFGVTELLDEFIARPHHGKVRFLQWIESFLARRADRIIVPSQYLKNVVTKWGVRASNIEVIYNGISVPADLPSKSEARKRLKLSSSTFLAVSAGRDVPWKGFGLLAEAVRELNKEIEKVALHIVSNKPRGVVLTEIQAADAFVLNTGYEGFPFLVLEAMMLGTPVITTNIGGNPELVEHEEDGLLVPYNSKKEIQSALERLLNEPRLRKLLSENGKKKAREFTVERMVDQTESILLSLII